MLAGLYAAVFWFSPLGWWLKRKLSDLGEAISDRPALKKLPVARRTPRFCLNSRPCRANPDRSSHGSHHESLASH